VTPESEPSRLAALTAEYPNDHLLLGVLYARAGALDEARQEWKLTGAQADRLMHSIDTAAQP
jgi:hypothetical protein